MVSQLTISRNYFMLSMTEVKQIITSHYANVKVTDIESPEHTANVFVIVNLLKPFVETMDINDNFSKLQRILFEELRVYHSKNAAVAFQGLFENLSSQSIQNFLSKSESEISDEVESVCSRSGRLYTYSNRLHNRLVAILKGFGVALESCPFMFFHF